MIISIETKPEKIEVGDDVVYKGLKGDFNGKVITHQVVSIEKDSNGKYMFHAKGLSNLVEDPVVYEDQLYGVVVYRMPILSFIYKIVGTTYGLFFFVVIPLLYIIGIRERRTKKK